jgi:hypothetical protein
MTALTVRIAILKYTNDRERRHSVLRVGRSWTRRRMWQHLRQFSCALGVQVINSGNLRVQKPPFRYDETLPFSNIEMPRCSSFSSMHNGWVPNL